MSTSRVCCVYPTKRKTLTQCWFIVGPAPGGHPQHDGTDIVSTPRVCCVYPTKPETLTQCWFIVGPAPGSLLQHDRTDIVSTPRVCWVYRNKHETVIHCCNNDGPASQTLDQHGNNIRSRLRVCWDAATGSQCCASIYIACPVMSRTNENKKTSLRIQVHV